MTMSRSPTTSKSCVVFDMMPGFFVNCLWGVGIALGAYLVCRFSHPDFAKAHHRGLVTSLSIFAGLFILMALLFFGSRP